ncbi:MAG: hypothetical protein F6K58_05815 [Symploca sp. SIO2E9]|nr:hypothetical protein [Symploca sp. SIO2E9]
MRAYREVREAQPPRKQKKKRKRQIAQGVFQTVSGVALLTGNTTFPELMVYSCTLGISAFMQAGVHFIGETE